MKNDEKKVWYPRAFYTRMHKALGGDVNEIWFAEWIKRVPEEVEWVEEKGIQEEEGEEEGRQCFHPGIHRHDFSSSNRPPPAPARTHARSAHGHTRA